MHTRFFADQRVPKLEDLAAHAEAVGLDKDAFQQCLDSGKYASEIRNDIGEARRAGVRSTPTFLLGFVQADGMVKATKMILGAKPYAAFKQAIEELLASKKE
jgi:predicted DsbA family dithiol-disulfide isomerase